MRHSRPLAALAALTSVVALGLAAPAQAAPPVHGQAEPSTYHLAAGQVCTFPVTVVETTNTERSSLFSDGRIIVSGAYKVSITNDMTGASISVNASGPGFFDASSTAREAGPQIFFMFPGDFRGPGLYLLTGHVTATRADDGSVASWSTTGTTSDNLCGRL